VNQFLTYEYHHRTQSSPAGKGIKGVVTHVVEVEHESHLDESHNLDMEQSFHWNDSLLQAEAGEEEP